MAVVGFKDTFHGELSAAQNSAYKSTTREAITEMKNRNKGLHDYMLRNAVCYDDNSVIAGGAGGREAKEYPEAALAVWKIIASEMANRFNVDRVGESKPNFKKGSPKIKTSTYGMPITGFQPNQTPVLIEPKGWEKKTKDLILNWFKANYDSACTDGDKKTDISTVPTKTANDIAGKLTKQFNNYYDGAQFGCEGVPLPAIMLDKLRQTPIPEFMPFCKPHKDAPGNTETVVGGKAIRQGALGYVIGEFNSNKQVIEVMNGSQQKEVEIDDNTHKEKVGVFKEDAANLDQNEFLIDDEFYNAKVKEALGSFYPTFRKNVKNLTGEDGPSGLPIDGKQIMLPPENEGEAPKPLLVGSPPKPFYNLDRRGNGLEKRAVAGGLPNPGFNQPLDDPAYGAAEMDGEIKVREWKNNSEKPMVFGPTRDKAGTWGSPRSGIKFGQGDEEVKCYMKFIKEDIGPTGKKRSASDPRTWGPWTEYEGNGVSGELSKDAEMVKAGLHKLKYKYIIPTGLVTAINTPNTAIPHKAGAGLPGDGGNTLPAINKQYWGLRIMEAFPNATSPADAIGKALAPPKTDENGTPLVLPGMAGILLKGGSTFIGGPAPPFIVKEKGSTKRGFEYSNKKVLFKGGNVGRGSGTPFSRGSEPTPGQYRDYSENNAKVNEQIDKKVAGEARGGMTWFDASKQIIPPYAPPPLKPPLPNTKKFDF